MKVLNCKVLNFHLFSQISEDTFRFQLLKSKKKNLLPYYLFKMKVKRVIAFNIRTTGHRFANTLTSYKQLRHQALVSEGILLKEVQKYHAWLMDFYTFIVKRMRNYLSHVKDNENPIYLTRTLNEYISIVKILSEKFPSLPVILVLYVLVDFTIAIWFLFCLFFHF